MLLPSVVPPLFLFAINYRGKAGQVECKMRSRRDIEDTKKGLVNRQVLLGSGGWIRTNDLRVMSPTSYLCSTPHSVIPYWKSCAKVRLFCDMDKFFFLEGAQLTIQTIGIKCLRVAFNIKEKGLSVGKKAFLILNIVKFTSRHACCSSLSRKIIVVNCPSINHNIFPANLRGLEECRIGWCRT